MSESRRSVYPMQGHSKRGCQGRFGHVEAHVFLRHIRPYRSPGGAPVPLALDRVATEGKVLRNAIGNLAILYLVIGIGIVAAQRFTGTHCDPPRMVPKVTANYPSPIIGALIWPASFYENVWKKDVPLREYLSPSICVEAKG